MDQSTSVDIAAIIDEDQSLVNREKIFTPPIDNRDVNSEEVILLDISCGKDWIAYVTHHKEPDNGYYSSDENGDVRTFITRRAFTEPFREDHHFSLEITQYLKYAGPNHCKFLSVSPDGKYVALSFYERNLAPGDKIFKPAQNPYCLIFKVGNGSLTFDCKLKCNGRAVFLNKRYTSLALIDLNTLKAYDNFSSYQ